MLSKTCRLFYWTKPEPTAFCTWWRGLYGHMVKWIAEYHWNWILCIPTLISSQLIVVSSVTNMERNFNSIQQRLQNITRDKWKTRYWQITARRSREMIQNRSPRNKQKDVEQAFPFSIKDTIEIRCFRDFSHVQFITR